MALTAAQAIERTKKQLSELIERKPEAVTGISQEDGVWHVSIEVLERKAIPDHMDLLARYDVVLDEEGNLIKFDRRGLRTRSEATKYEEE